MESSPFVLMQINPIIAFVAPLSVPKLEVALCAPVAIGPIPAVPALCPRSTVGHVASGRRAKCKGKA